MRNPDGRRIDDRRGIASGPAEERRLATAESLRLVVRFQAGDPDAFRAIYVRHFDGVYGYLLTALRDRHEAEDGAQEVFIRVLRGLPRYEFRGAAFEAWLFRIVRNHTLNVKQRSAPVSPADPARIDVWRDHRDLRMLMSRESVGGDRDLLLHIERLPPSQRQVLVLRYMVGLDWNDIASVLDRSSGAVRQLEQRALTYLRKRLEAVEQGAAARNRGLPMRRQAWPSPVTVSRRRALLDGARAA